MSERLMCAWCGATDEHVVVSDRWAVLVYCRGCYDGASLSTHGQSRPEAIGAWNAQQADLREEASGE